MVRGEGHLNVANNVREIPRRWPIQVVNDKGAIANIARWAPPETVQAVVECHRNFQPIMHRILQLLFASDTPFLVWTKAWPSRNWICSQFPSRAVAQPGPSEAQVVWRQIGHANLTGTSLHRIRVASLRGVATSCSPVRHHHSS